jgi:protease IV
MLKKFFLVVCGSFVGVWLALTVFTIISVIMSFVIFGSMQMSSSSKSIESKSILYIKLAGPIPERSKTSEQLFIEELRGGDKTSSSLSAILASIKKAKDNDKIKGIFIDCQGSTAAPATLYEIRQAVKDFKSSKKFVYAYGDQGIDQSDYYVATAADSIFLNPIGAVDIHGMQITTMFYKKLLAKVGVGVQVIRVGAFKSAVEPYILDSISPANRLQQQHFIGTIWKSMADSIAGGRHLTAAKINQLADSMVVLMPADTLVSQKVIDGVCYRSEFENKLRKLTDVDEKDDLNLVYPEDIATDLSDGSGSSKIAIVYAVGEIDGIFSQDGINSEDLIETIRELQFDDDVKGIVFRVNSPGGSAYGSEQIWKALDEFKKSGKTLAVSMGDYAASGGYYISCGAQRIFAEPVTITGSIGIFGMIPSFKTLTEDKLGITQSVVETNANSDFGNVTKDLTPAQTAALQNMINRGYDLFTKRCAAGRNVSQDSIKKIAQGRVWDAITAKKIGLVDEFGGIAEATKWVANKAGLKEGSYKTVIYPKADDSWQALLNQYASTKYEQKLQNNMGMFYQYYDEVKEVLGRKRVLCLMEPFEIK